MHRALDHRLRRLSQVPEYAGASARISDHQFQRVRRPWHHGPDHAARRIKLNDHRQRSAFRIALNFEDRAFGIRRKRHLRDFAKQSNIVAFVKHRFQDSAKEQLAIGK